MQVISAVAEFERDLLLERTHSGIARAKAAGKRFGRPSALNEEQQRAFEEILGRVQAAKPSVTLLHGVTGSGKTQVYLRLVQETLALGKTAMVLVPEIVLTPQMMRKFSSYFGSRVAMLHSSLKMTERYD